MAIRLRGSHATEDRRLDRLPPPDWEHYQKFPLTARTAPSEPSPVVLGINWYSNFDRPIKLGSTFWIGRGDLGRIRGGHAIAVDDHGVHGDLAGWWHYYDQGVEGACVFFAVSRVASLLNRRRYVPRGGYFQAQRADEWPGGAYPGASPSYDGTSVRAGFGIWMDEGHTPARRSEPVSSDRWEPKADEGISAYRWLNSVDEVRAVTGVPDHQPGVRLLNSWGNSYPRVVRITDEALERVIQEDGEVAVATDR